LEWFVKEVQYNSLRILIGFFTLGPEWCVGTEFGSVKEVYGNSWEAVKEVVERAREWGVGVLIGSHAAYSGANCDAHSRTSSGNAELWGNKENLERGR